MYLPFLLLGQYGWMGFLAFAVPNVLGCAAFGYVLRREDAAALRQRLGGWTRAFTLVTIAFQCWFAGAMLPWPVAIAVIPGGLLLGSQLGSRGWLTAAVAAAVVTVACFTTAFTTPIMQFMQFMQIMQFTQLPWQGTLPEEGLFFLAPAIALGFLACPYLDLTFHRALEESPSKHSFAIFGAAFACTLLGIATIWNPQSLSVPVSMGLVVLWSVQMAFTIGAHARESWFPLNAAFRTKRTALLALCFVALGAGWIMRLPAEGSLGSLDEAYTRWLVFYGLVFPFFLLFRLRGVPTSWSWLAIAASLPCYELGFIRHETIWLILPLGLLVVLLIARLAKDGVKENNAS